MGTEVVRELVTKFTFKADQSAVTRFQGAIGGLRRAIIGIGAVGAAAAAGLFAIARSTARVADETIENASKIGISTRAYQELSYAAQRSGTTIQAVGGAVGILSKNLVAAQAGTGDVAATFKRLGVSVVNADGSLRDADSVLGDLANVFQRMPEGPEKVALSMTLLGKSGREMLPMLNEGRAGLDRMRQSANDLGIVMDDATLKAGERFQDSLLDMQSALTGIKNTIGASVMPVISKMVERLTAWFKANRQVIGQNIEAVLGTLASLFLGLFEGVMAVMDALGKLIELMGGTRRVMALLKVGLLVLIGARIFSGFKALIGLVRTLGIAFNWAGMKALWAQVKIFAIPLAIGAIIAAVVLLAEDIYQWVTGGESLLKRFFDRIKNSTGFFGRVYRGIRAAFGWVASVMVAWFNWIVSAGAWIGGMFVAAWEWLGNAAGAVQGFFGGVFDWIFGKLTWLWDKAVGILNGIKNTVREIGEALGLADTESEKNVGRGASALARLSAMERETIMQRAQRAAQRVGGTANVEQIARNMALQREQRAAQASANVGAVNVNVQGSTNMGPDQLRRAVGQGVSDGLQPTLDRVAAATAGSTG
jgi:hypothetical protein